CVKQNQNQLPEKKGGETMPEKQKQKILMIVAPEGFQEKEYFGPKNIFENAGYEVITATKGATKARSSQGTTINIGLQLNQVSIDDFSALVFVGGPGTTVYLDDQEVLTLAKEAVQKGKALGAICLAPSILANAGVLNGKRATAFPSEENNLKAKGAIFTGEAVTVEGKIVTGNGPAAAEEFGKKIVEVLKK
ncbi:MAG: DJ-1/PfpI family protein, partial [Microgenomates group bacterium]